MGLSRFVLPDGEVAFYEWGAYTINLAPLVGQGKDTIPRILDGIYNGRAFWADDAEFKRGVAILHECVHCLQDLTTGVGLWDFLLRMDSAPGILGEWRVASYSSPFGKPLPADMRSNYDRWLNRGFVPQSEEATQRRLVYLRERLAAEPRITLTGTKVFAIDRLLEAEAVAQVHLVLTSLSMNDEQLQIMSRQRSLWSAPDMADLYQGVYHDVIGVCREWAQADGVEINGPIVMLALTLTALLLEISLAHPSPALVEQSGLDARDYDPGLKFLLLLAALAHLPLVEHDVVLRAVGARNLEEVERILLTHCSIPYPHSRTIYTDWITQLELRQGDDRRIDLRLHALAQRLEQASGVLSKSTITFFEFGLPLIVASDGGFRLTSMNPDYILGETRFELVADIAREQAVTRLFCSAIEGVPFVCSHAEYGICPARTDLCTEGISHARDFPVDDQCVVRRMLEANQFGTFRRDFND